MLKSLLTVLFMVLALAILVSILPSVDKTEHPLFSLCLTLLCNTLVPTLPVIAGYIGYQVGTGLPMSIQQLSAGERINVLFACTSTVEQPITNHYLIKRENGRHQFIKTGDTLRPGPAMVVLNNGSNILMALHENNQPF